MTLWRFGIEATSVFELWGKDENSATFALGWAIDACPTFRKALVAELIGMAPTTKDEIVVELQRHHEEGGFTDIEVSIPNFCHLIVEAKRGWSVPTEAQLAMYARRLRGHARSVKKIISLSAASHAYAVRHLPKMVADIHMLHRSWADISRLTNDARRTARSLEEKLWLRHLSQHLAEYVSMQNPRDNQVYVVALSAQPINEGDEYSWIDVVVRDKQYFHPMGNHWPPVPPNYLGFRYHGRLQSVHHVDACEVVGDLSEYNPHWPKREDDTEHFVYRLGTPMLPAREVRTGNVYRNGRVWCAIDTLLSGECSTIREAKDATQQRLANTLDEPQRWDKNS